ncbi:MAG: hypothetical protein V3571_15500 [Pseudodesulfovibrio sp.]
MTTMIATSGARPESALEQPVATIRWIDGADVREILAILGNGEARYAHFEDPALFADAGRCLQLCVLLRERRINILWSARMNGSFGGGRLRMMRMAGCRKIIAAVDGDALVDLRGQAREFGLEYVIVRPDGMVLNSGEDGYTVAEREAVAERLPGVHSVQYDLAVACFKAGQFDKVMGPLGRAVALGFPATELSLNLLACMKAVKEFPSVADGRSVQTIPGSPHPVVLRNRRLVRFWLESGGNIKDARMLLDPGEAFANY